MSAPVGNFYDKYTAKNPIEKLLVSTFLSSLRDVLTNAAPASILDIGCGEGYVTGLARRWLPEATLVACDTDPAMLTSIQGDWPLVAARLPHIPIPDASFDLVLLCEVLEHVEDPVQALESVARLARRDVVISVPHEPFWHFCNMARGAYWADFGNTPGHINHFSGRHLVRLLRRHFPEVTLYRPFPWLLAHCRKT